MILGNIFPVKVKSGKIVSSSYFLSETVKLIRKSGFEIVNIDSTVVLQKPKLAKYIPSIVDNLSLIMGKENACISVKATTTDGLGFAGTGKGWSVFAIATLNQKV